MKDITLNVSFVERGVRTFCVINGAFIFAFTKWFVLIPILFYCWFTAMCGYCFVKQMFRTMMKKKYNAPRKSGTTTVLTQISHHYKKPISHGGKK